MIEKIDKDGLKRIYLDTNTCADIDDYETFCFESHLYNVVRPLKDCFDCKYWLEKTCHPTTGQLREELVTRGKYKCPDKILYEVKEK